MGHATYQSGEEKPSRAQNGHVRKGRPIECCRSCVRRRTIWISHITPGTRCGHHCRANFASLQSLPTPTLEKAARSPQLVLRLIPSTDEYPLPRFPIVDDGCAGPCLPSFSYTCCCIVE